MGTSWHFQNLLKLAPKVAILKSPFRCADVRFITIVEIVRGCEKMSDASVNQRKTSDWVPASASTVAQMIRQHEELSAWLREQSAELLESYPDKWVGTGADV